MDCSEFGPFAQRMLDLGLVFNITFTEGELAELRAHANWAMFDRKFMDGISTLPAGLELPPWPLNIQPSVNATLWTLVKCNNQAKRGQPGLRVFHLGHPPGVVGMPMYMLDKLIQELTIPNPISYPDDTPVPHNLVIIGRFLRHYSGR